MECSSLYSKHASKLFGQNDQLNILLFDAILNQIISMFIRPTGKNYSVYCCDSQPDMLVL